MSLFFNLTSPNIHVRKGVFILNNIWREDKTETLPK